MKKRPAITIFIFMAIVLFGISLSLYTYTIRATKNATERAKTVLLDNAAEQAVTLKAALTGKFLAIVALAAGVDDISEQAATEFFEQLKSGISDTDMYSAAIIDSQGEGWTSLGEHISVAERKYFIKALGGEHAMQMVDAQPDGVNLVILAVPIMNDEGTAIGVMAAAYSEEGLRQFVESSAFEGQGYNYVVDSSGNVIVGTDSTHYLSTADNVFNTIVSDDFKSNITAEDIKTAIEERASMAFTCTLLGEDRLVVFAPMDTEQVADEVWFIVNVVSLDVVEKEASAEKLNGIEQVVLLFIFGGLAAGVFAFNERVNRKKLEKESQALRTENQRFNVVYNAATISVWDFDFSTREIRQDQRSMNVHGFGRVIRDVPESLIKNGYVHPDSARPYLEMYRKLLTGAKTAEGVFRVQTADRQDWWYESIRYTTIYDENGKPYAAIGMSEDVTARREQEMAYNKWQKEISAIGNDNSSVFGWNLTRDTLDGSEKSSFKAVKIMSPKAGFNELAKVYADEYVYYEDSAELLRFVNRERLIGLYYDDVFSDEMDYRENSSAGEYRWMHLIVQLVQYPDSEEIKAYVISRDIDREKREELELIARSERDSLTDALNRDAFENRVNKLLQDSEAGTCHAFLMMDIDEFKAVNDTFGHDAGDKMLEELINAIRSVLRFDDIIGRIGGDEFMVCMKDVSYDAVIEKKAQQLCEILRRKLSDEVMVSLSLGISVFPRDGLTFDALYKAADMALYYTKENGKDGYNFYSPEMLRDTKASNVPVQGTIISEPLPKKRMLIIDDSDGDRQTLGDIFEEEFAVITAKTATGALSQIRRYGSSISLVLLGLNSSLSSGLEIMAQMKSESLLSLLPIIVVTSMIDQQTYLNVIAQGASDLIPKPIDADLAKVRVHGVLARVENERVRAQKNYLRLQGAEEERYRRVLCATGTVVILHDWQNNIFSYDANISQYLGANFDDRPLDKIFIEDGICTQAELAQLGAMEKELVKDQVSPRRETVARFTVPGGEKHVFRIQLIKMSAEYEMTEKTLITINDINDAAMAEEELKRRAERDPLTGLYNRETFFAKAGEMVYSERPSSYIMAAFDINNFKTVNEQYGQAVGDQVLKRMSEMGQEVFEKIGGITCRLSADNFAGVYPSSTSSVDFITEQRTFIMEELGLNVSISFSVGRYVIEDLSLQVSAMYDRANMAKKSIKGRYDVHTAYYNASMREEFLREQMIVGSMEQALSEKQFIVYFQPQYNHSTGAMVGAEALVRWLHPDEGLISPAAFIPIFERNGFIYKLDIYVWENTCSLMRQWMDKGISVLPVSVNVSRFDIFQPDFFHVITSLVSKYNLPTDILRLEITETAFSSSPKQIIKVVKRLVDYGFVVEIDDFGSGYSSLNTLKDVPAQILKLDMRFMEDSESTQRGGSIINSVVRMAKWLYMPVIAEGVETIQQADFLKSIGCDYVQGYLYARPIPYEEYAKLLEESPKETRMEALRTISTLHANAFWDPNSMETLIFNSYVGGAAVIEYCDGKLEYLRINDKFRKELNVETITERDVLASDPLAFSPEEGKLTALAALERAAETDEEQEFDLYNYYPENKAYTWLKCRVRVIGRSAGRTLYYLAIENTTREKLAEQKIKETGEQLETIMDTIDSGVCAYAVQDYYHGYVLFANTQYYNMFGYTEEQFQNEVKTIFDVIHPDEKRRVVRHTVEAMGSPGELISYDYRGIRRDGSSIIVHGDSRIISVSGEENQVLLVITTDVTNKVEEAQAEELRQYTDALLGVYDEIFEFNLQTNSIKRLDSSIDSRFAVSGELEPRIFQLIGTLIHHDDQKRVLEFYKSYSDERTGKNSEIEFRLYSEGKPIWIKCRIIALTDTRYIVMIHDETQEKNTALAAERYHMILNLLTDEEAPFGIVLINTATAEYELISSVAQARNLPAKGKYSDMVDYLMTLIPKEQDVEDIRRKIQLDTILKGITERGVYSFQYEFDNVVARGLREVVVRYSDDWKNEIIMAVRLKGDKRNKAGSGND
jgi:diguanylate cyclase (GGDEF)-like protein/PAS domain S-box-containing protein